MRQSGQVFRDIVTVGLWVVVDVLFPVALLALLAWAMVLSPW